MSYWPYFRTMYVESMRWWQYILWDPLYHQPLGLFFSLDLDLFLGALLWWLMSPGQGSRWIVTQHRGSWRCKTREQLKGYFFKSIIKQTCHYDHTYHSPSNTKPEYHVLEEGLKETTVNPSDALQRDGPVYCTLDELDSNVFTTPIDVWRLLSTSVTKQTGKRD